jgi:hypothetical protein
MVEEFLILQLDIIVNILSKVGIAKMDQKTSVATHKVTIVGDSPSQGTVPERYRNEIWSSKIDQAQRDQGALDRGTSFLEPKSSRSDISPSLDSVGNESELSSSLPKVYASREQSSSSSPPFLQQQNAEPQDIDKPARDEEDRPESLPTPG